MLHSTSNVHSGMDTATRSKGEEDRNVWMTTEDKQERIHPSIHPFIHPLFTHIFQCMYYSIHTTEPGTFFITIIIHDTSHHPLASKYDSEAEDE